MNGDQEMTSYNDNNNNNNKADIVVVIYSLLVHVLYILRNVLLFLSHNVLFIYSIFNTWGSILLVATFVFEVSEWLKGLWVKW